MDIRIFVSAGIAAFAIGTLAGPSLAGFDPAGAAAPPSSPRPVLHFTPEKNWTNDPNGLIWNNGEYHLFYQYNPEGDQWGHMSWGHAVSTNLFDWRHLPLAIPEGGGVMIYSGSAVFDRKNTSGFGTAANPPLVAVYAGHDDHAHLEHQNIAYSTDHGRTFTKFAGNPVIDLHAAEFRDPKVFWHAPTNRWIMVVALSAEHKALFFASPNLKQWTKVGEFGPQGQKNVPNWECPDLFEMPLEGKPGESRWVLTINVGGGGPCGGSACQYFVGRFDGTAFTNDNPPEQVLWLDQGPDFYAFQSYADVPDNKRIGLAWMTSTRYAGGQPTSPWRGSMTIPREFTLRETPAGPRVAQAPAAGAEEFLKSRGGVRTTLADLPVPAGVTPIKPVGRTAIIRVELDPGSAERCGVRVREGADGKEFTAVGYDAKTHEIFIDRRHAGESGFHPEFAGRYAAVVSAENTTTNATAPNPVAPNPVAPNHDNHIRLTIVVDEQSVELFSADGLAAITTLVFPKPESRGFSLFAEGGGGAKLVRMEVVAIGGE